MRIKHVLEFLTWVLYISRAPLAQAIPSSSGAQTCTVSTTPNIDFVCGNPVLPYQPCNDFTLEHGSATQDTHLWLLAENHHKHTSTTKCVDLLSESMKKHTVYVEGISAGKKAECSQHGIFSKPGRTCKGWDDVDGLELLNAAHFPVKVGMQIVTLQKVQKEENFSDAALDKYVKSLFEKVNRIEKAAETRNELEVRNHRTNIDTARAALAWVSQQRKEGKSYKHIFSSAVVKFDSLNSTQIENIKRSNKMRGMSLMQTLLKHPKDVPAILISGYRHLVLGDRDSLPFEDAKRLDDQFREAVEYVQEELEKGKDQNPYAILALKN